MSRPPFSLGREIACVSDINADLHAARQQQFDFVLVPIAQQHATPPEPPRQVSTPAKPFSTAEIRGSVYGKVSAWIDPDAADPGMRRNSEEALRREIEWWAHLGMAAAILPMPRSMACSNYARLVNQLAAGLRNMKLLLRVPLQAEDDDRSWHVWNRFRNLCEQHPALGLALDIRPPLPGQAELDRWLGEPLYMAIWPTALFTETRGSPPALPGSHHFLAGEFFLRLVKQVISGPGSGDVGQSFVAPMVERYRALPPPDRQELHEAPWYDVLMPPLQPLMDNLDSATYEVFELDPVKYQRYEEAIHQALVERHGPDERVVIMVVGAGRGPLVRRALRAAAKAGRRVFVYAVEKNPNAVLALGGAYANENWQGRVEIVAGDMRSWVPPEPADILVSELLGSFGDNELSPECLDGAQRHLKPESGISIPAESTSWLAPISSQRLHNKVAALGDARHFETGFVVRMRNFCQLDGAKACFRFVHPNRSPDPAARDNSRYVDLAFEARSNAMIHGFAGYFESILYRDIRLSILPETSSGGMSAWYPIYWPLRQPVQVARGQRIGVQFWRQTGPRDVWYEWALSEPQCTPIHNPNGRSYKIGL